MLTADLLSSLVSQYQFIIGTIDAKDRDDLILEIRAQYSEIGADEYKLRELVNLRFLRVLLEQQKKSNENLIQSIDARFSNFASADIERMADKLRDELEGIKYKTDSILAEVQKKTEDIITRNAMSIIDQIAKHAEDELFNRVVDKINERVTVAISKTVKRLWLLGGCVLGGSIGVLVMWVLHHLSIFR